jgi:hypothetical protein
MARRLPKFPEVEGQRKYPWGEWLDGDPIELIPGEDFTAKTRTLIANARLQAKRRGGEVRTRILGEGEQERVVLQFRQGR